MSRWKCDTVSLLTWLADSLLPVQAGLGCGRNRKELAVCSFSHTSLLPKITTEVAALVPVVMESSGIRRTKGAANRKDAFNEELSFLSNKYMLSVS